MRQGWVRFGLKHDPVKHSLKVFIGLFLSNVSDTSEYGFTVRKKMDGIEGSNHIGNTAHYLRPPVPLYET